MPWRERCESKPCNVVLVSNDLNQNRLTDIQFSSRLKIISNGYILDPFIKQQTVELHCTTLWLKIKTFGCTDLEQK